MKTGTEIGPVFTQAINNTVGRGEKIPNSLLARLQRQPPTSLNSVHTAGLRVLLCSMCWVRTEGALPKICSLERKSWLIICVRPKPPGMCAELCSSVHKQNVSQLIVTAQYPPLALKKENDEYAWNWSVFKQNLTSQRTGQSGFVNSYLLLVDFPLGLPSFF